MSFEGKTALVTGGASGIGLATARALLLAGATVCIIDRDADGLERARVALGSDIRTATADVREIGELERAVESLEERAGPITLLHNHAGVLEANDGSVLDVRPEVFVSTLMVNVVGQFNVAQVAARRIAGRGGGGAIVNTASDLSLIALPGLCSYVTSKTAILGLTRSMAADLAPHGIRVNAVCPGFVSTRMTAGLEADTSLMEDMKTSYLIKELGRPEDVAGVVRFLLSAEARYVTGAAVVVDGGHVVT